MAGDVSVREVKVIQFWNELEPNLKVVCREGFGHSTEKYMRGISKLCAACYSR